MTSEATTAPNTHFENRFRRELARVERLGLPASWLRWLRNLALGRAVPLVGTCKLDYAAIEDTRLEVRLANHPAVRNHLGQIHACAMILMAETATGFLIAYHLPDSSVPLIKTIRVEFQRRSQGAMRAVATLSPEQVQLVRSSPKGETWVPVTVTDASGEPPIHCEMLWAWVPKR